MIRKLKKRRWLGLALGLLLFPLLCFALLAVEVYAYSAVSDSSAADAAIVLGASVWEGRPSPVFEERIKHAIHLYETGTIRVLIFTGGVGVGDQQAESEAARNYAVQHGVPAEHIYCETVSRFTHENLREAKQIVEQQGLARVLVVSDPLHMRRAVTIARDLGLDAYPSPTTTSRYRTWTSKLNFLLRETFFYAAYLVSRPVVHSLAVGFVIVSELWKKRDST